MFITLSRCNFAVQRPDSGKARACVAVVAQVSLLVPFTLLAVFATAGSPAKAQTLQPNFAMAPQVAKGDYFAVGPSQDGRDLRLFLFPLLQPKPNSLTCREAPGPIEGLADGEVMTALAIDHSDRCVAIGTNKGNVMIADLPNINVPESSVRPLAINTDKIEYKSYGDELSVTAVAFQPDSDQKLAVAFWDDKKKRGLLRLYERNSGVPASYGAAEVPDILTEGRVDAITFTDAAWSTYTYRETVGGSASYKQIDERGFGHPLDAPTGRSPQYKGQIVASADGALLAALATDTVTGKTEIAVWNATTSRFLNYIDVSVDAPAMPLTFSIAAKTGDICLFSIRTGAILQPLVARIPASKMPDRRFDPNRLAQYEAFLRDYENDQADPRMAMAETTAYLNSAQTLLELEDNKRAFESTGNRDGLPAKKRLELLGNIPDLKKQCEEEAAMFSADAHRLEEMIAGARLKSAIPDWAAMDDLKRSLTASAQSFDRRAVASLWSKAKDDASRAVAIVDCAGGRTGAESAPNAGLAQITVAPNRPTVAPSINGGRPVDATVAADSVSAVHFAPTPKRYSDAAGPVRVVTATHDFVAAINGDTLHLWKLDKDDSSSPLHPIKEPGPQGSPEEFLGLNWFAGKSGSDVGLDVCGDSGIVRQYSQSDFGKQRAPSLTIYQFDRKHMLTALAVPRGDRDDLLLAGTTVDQKKGEAQIVSLGTDGSMLATVIPLKMNDPSAVTTITTADFSPDNKRVAVGASMGRIAVFDVGPGTDAAHNAPSQSAARDPRSWIGPDKPGDKPNLLYCLRFLNDHELIWCRKDGYLYHAELPRRDTSLPVEGTRVTLRTSDSQGLLCLALSDENNGERLLAAGGGSGKIYLWHVRSASAQKEFTPIEGAIETHVDSVQSLAFVPGRNMLVAGGKDGTVEMYSYTLK